jgi:hypothetical protein
LLEYKAATSPEQGGLMLDSGGAALVPAVQ